jgi:hypothetical protein
MIDLLQKHSTAGRTTVPRPFSDTSMLQDQDCFLTAMVDGVDQTFVTSKQKFEALAASWMDYNLGRSVIDYHDFAFEQIIGMGAPVVPYLLERVAAGESEWIYALKCIAGQEAETPDMVGNDEQVIQAWIEWGRLNGNFGG